MIQHILSFYRNKKFNQNLNYRNSIQISKMDKSCVFLFTWIILSLFTNGALSVQTFKIGGMLSSSQDQQYFDNLISAQNTQKNTLIVFNSTSIIMSENPIRSALDLCDNLVAKGVHVMVVSHPPSTDKQAPISASYTAGFYGIPVMGISSRDSAFSDKNVHPTFLRIVPPYFHQADVWIEMLKYFEWKKVIFIHSMDEEGRMILSRFQALAEKDKDNVIEYFNFSKEDAFTLYEDAKKLNLTGTGYAWIVSEQAWKASNVPVGVIGLELKPETEEYMRDSVVVITTAVTKIYLKEEKIAKGATGQISFNDAGDRLNPVYYFRNVHPTIVDKVGFFEKKELSKSAIQINEESIKWPGGGTKRPIGLKITTRLKVVTLQALPFVYVKKLEAGKQCSDYNAETNETHLPCPQTNSTTGEVTQYCCKGYCIDMLIKIAKKVNFTYDIHLSEDNSFGTYARVNGSKEKVWNGMIGEVIREKADLIVAPLTINPERDGHIDFTKPFKYQGLTILVKKMQKDSSLASFLQPFQDTLWILVGLSVHVVALVLYLLDRFSPFGRFKLAKSDDTEEDALNLSSAMWFAWGVLLNSGIGEGTPRSFSARVLGMVWAGFAMIIVASYTANLAAFLVLDRPEAYISGIDDARLRNPNEDFTYATVKDSAVEMYFKRQVELSTMYRQMEPRNCKTAEEAIAKVKSGDLQAFIWDSSRLEYEAANDCELIIAGEMFGRSGLGIGLRKNSPWTRAISLAILKLHERGIMEELDNQWILKRSTDCPQRYSAPATLGLTNMAGWYN
ncbi:hypothetical protein KUTeg_007631 [Tegillarca granosa]|uniref:Glutamate receptor n=1 Tax=Tegillarca granosa TaxID=220873 RepID=A0ABQ9FFS5_TEGGR|nr:hypothetical protein KUTeg_007631 [Tegillarca granosa]